MEGLQSVPGDDDNADVSTSMNEVDNTTGDQTRTRIRVESEIDDGQASTSRKRIRVSVTP